MINQEGPSYSIASVDLVVALTPLLTPYFFFLSWRGRGYTAEFTTGKTYDLVETLSSTQTGRASTNDENVNSTEDKESVWRCSMEVEGHLDNEASNPYMSGWVILP